MTDVRIAMRPKTGSSLYFAIGAPGNDPQLRLARAWANGIKGTQGDEVSVGSVGSFMAIHDDLLKIRDRTPTLKLGDVTATGPARGLPLHTLVIIAPRHPKPDGGLVLSGHFGAGQTDVVLSSAALDQFNGMPTVTPRQQKRYDLAMLGWTLVAQTTSIVLLGVGPGDPLDKLAVNLANRTLCSVFYNTAPVHFIATAGALTKVQVGDPAVSGPAFAGAAPTLLEATASTFLPGAQARKDPPPPSP